VCSYIVTQILTVNSILLTDLVEHGVAFHNGALAHTDRKLIEDCFLKSLISVICTTSTLAVGVNLPAHLVIIKSTHQYVNGTTRDYSELDMMQMLGRAGRPQFDDSGVAVILTSSDKKMRYEQMVCGKEIIESR
jgi:ATP-dependent DNA helicase HFM1/MER3